MHLWQRAKLKCVVFWWHASMWPRSHASLTEIRAPKGQNVRKTWQRLQEKAENNRGGVTESVMFHVGTCSRGFVTVKLNVTHYWLSHLPLLLFVLPDCFLTFTYKLQLKHKVSRQANRPCYWGAQCKVFSCVVMHMQHICACDNTHPALTLYIPDFSGPENRSPPPPFCMSSVLLTLPNSCPFTPHLNLILQKRYMYFHLF